MNKKVDERLPRNSGKKILPSYAAIRSPWEKIICYRDAMHFVSRYNSVISATIMQAFRIMIPDYEERAVLMCEEAYAKGYNNHLRLDPSGQYNNAILKDNIHPFCRGNFVGAIEGDIGDEALLMCGRVNDFGTYRCEKELDVCDWDIVGTELCRATTASLQGACDAMGDALLKGPRLEYTMCEAKGCGDRHCRVVAESREKYPLPERENWQRFGPIATADYIKYTPDEECVTESEFFRRECNYTYSSGTNVEQDDSSASFNAFSSAGTWYLLPEINYAIQKNVIDEKFADHVLKCVCEAAGKAAFGEQFSKEALRIWLGVPRTIGDDDGRVLGGYIEMYLQCMTVPYEVEAFNEKEVIYVIDRHRLSLNQPKFVDCLLSYWYGISKTLINSGWAVWEEPNENSDSLLRLKIAKKIDKFC